MHTHKPGRFTLSADRSYQMLYEKLEVQQFSAGTRFSRSAFRFNSHFERALAGKRGAVGG
jgi:hypothetical protein